jgi:hypothetical protein
MILSCCALMGSRRAISAILQATEPNLSVAIPLQNWRPARRRRARGGLFRFRRSRPGIGQARCAAEASDYLILAMIKNIAVQAGGR